MRLKSTAPGVLASLAALALMGSASQAQNTAPQSIFEAQSHSVVKIGGGANTGTGFIVSDEGHVITALHVVEGLRPNTLAKDIPNNIRAVARGAGNCFYDAALVGASAPLDIAVYKIKRKIGPEGDGCHRILRPLRVDWTSDPRELTGRRVYLIGNPRDCSDTGEIGCFQIRATRIATDDQSGASFADTASLEGYSGGPVLMDRVEGPDSGEAIVVGLILATGYDRANNSYTRLVPMSSIQRAFWGFGIIAGEHVRDYTPTLGRLIDKAEVIEESPSRLATLADEIEIFKREANDRISSLSRELEILKTKVDWTVMDNNNMPFLSYSSISSKFQPVRFRIEIVPVIAFAAQAARSGQGGGLLNARERAYSIDVEARPAMQPGQPAVFSRMVSSGGDDLGGAVMFTRTYRELLQLALDELNARETSDQRAQPEDVSSFVLRVHTTLSDGVAELSDSWPGYTVGREKFSPGM